MTNGYAVFRNTLWWRFAAGSGSGVIDNSIANLSRNTVASNYWTDATLTNLITDPHLAGISRTNDALLDPRPLPGSPAFSYYATTPADGFLTPAPYIGAFDANHLWIKGWTALAEYGIATPAPDAVPLTAIRNGAELWIVHPSEGGVNYQLQSATNLTPPVVWLDEGNPRPGTGAPITNTVPLSGPKKFFRVRSQ